MDYINECLELMKRSYFDFNAELTDKFRDIDLWNKHSAVDRCLSKCQFLEEVKRLEMRFEELNKNIVQYKNARDTYDKAIAEEQQIVASLSQKFGEKLIDLENKNEALKEADTLITQPEKGCIMRRKFSDSEYEKLKEISAMYSHGLSFKIDISRDGPVTCFKLSFTNIDVKNPQRVFSTKIRYGSDFGTCTIMECFPEISEIDYLEHKLNEDMDWHQFAVLLRKCFKKYVANE